MHCVAWYTTIPYPVRKIEAGFFYKSAKNLAKFHFPTGTKLAQPETDKPIELYPWTIPSATCAEVSSSSIDLGLLPAQKIVVQQQVVAYTMAAVA